MTTLIVPHRSFHVAGILTSALFALSVVEPVHAQRTASAPFEVFFGEVAIRDNGEFFPVEEATESQLAGNPLVFENHTEDHLPILRPDGVTQIRLNDLSSLTGTATFTEEDEGTLTTIRVDGLIPNGVYSAYIDLYAPPGFTPDFAFDLGAGALAYPTNNPPEDPFDYVGNVFVADETGHGELEIVQPPGPMSWFTTDLIEGFEIPNYILDPPVGEVDLILNYHIDGTGGGPRPSEPEGFDAFDSTWVGYSFAPFIVPEPASLNLGFFGLVFLLSCRSRHSERASA